MCYLCNDQTFNIDEYIENNKQKYIHKILVTQCKLFNNYLGNKDFEGHYILTLFINDDRFREQDVTITNLPTNIDYHISKQSSQLFGPCISNHPRIISTMRESITLLLINCPFIKKLPNFISKLPLGIFLFNCHNISINNISNLLFIQIEECNIRTINNLKNIGGLRVSNCQYLEKIDNLDLISSIIIEKCPQIYNIGKVQTIRKLYINECPKMISHPELILRHIVDCDNLMIILNLYRKIKYYNDDYYIIYNKYHYYRNKETDVSKFISEIITLQRQWRLKKSKKQ